MSLTIGEGIVKTSAYLAGLGMPSARLEAELLLAFVLDCGRVKLYQSWDQPLTPTEINAYRSVLRRRAQGVPLAYITGKKAFLNWDFQVDPSVLIPRPETELLVETALSAIDDSGEEPRETRCVDLGTGSGVIAISLCKLRPGLEVDAVDLSEQALAVAARNAELLGVGASIRFWHGNFLAAVPEERVPGGFDVAVSNPPYIPSREITGLSPEVRCEPASALDGGEDGLEAYREILTQLPGRLKVGGDLLVEHGFDQARPLKEMFQKAGFAVVTSLKDQAGFDRVLWGRRYRSD